MKELSKIALAVQPSATLAIDTMFKQMRADGLDVIGFGAGEPDFPPRPHQGGRYSGDPEQRYQIHSLCGHRGAAQGRVPAAEGGLRRGL